jgi:hypothetical protein
MVRIAPPTPGSASRLREPTSFPFGYDVLLRLLPTEFKHVCHSLHMFNRLLILAGAIVLSVLLAPFYLAFVVVGWAVIVVGYLVSLQLHPHYNCRACRGTGSHSGFLFGWSHRRCNSCGGQGRRRRLGTMMVSRDRQVWAERRQAAAGHRSNKPL